LVKLFLNQVLQCLRATLSSDVGWEGVLGAVPGSWQQVRQGQQQPVVEVAGAVATLMPLVSLVRRPAFKVRAVDGGVPSRTAAPSYLMAGDLCTFLGSWRSRFFGSDAFWA
jgi:hypothetical protein